MSGLYRPHCGLAWQDVEIVAASCGWFVLREVDRVFPGVWLASIHQVRVVA